MTQTEALKLALEALETCDEGDWSTSHVIYPSYDEKAVANAITAIKEALSETCIKQNNYTWIGLTDEDKKEYVAQDFGGSRLDAMSWAEKRLKEKNNG